MVRTILRSRQAAPVAAVVLGVLTLGFCLAAVPLDGVIHQNGPGGAVADWLSTATVVVPVAVVGVLLAARRPRNPIGWILLAILVLGFNPLGRVRRPGLPDASWDPPFRLGSGGVRQ